MSDNRDKTDEGLEQRLDDLDARLLEQEHRTVHVALNAYKYFSKETEPEKRSAAMRALFWRIFAPYTAAAIFAGGGSLVAIFSAYFLHQQNQKLEAQTRLLDRQTQIMAGEGQWELLWQAHNGDDQATRIESAVGLARDGVALSGLNLEGPLPLNLNWMTLDRAVDIVRLESAFADVAELPEVLFPSLQDTHLSRFRVFIERIQNRDIRRLWFRECEVSIGNAGFVVDCSFTASLLRPQGKGTTFRECTIDRSLIDHTPMGRGWYFERCQVRGLAILSSGERDPRGRPLDLESSEVGARSEYSIFFQDCDVWSLYIDGPSLVGIRASTVGTLYLEDKFRDQKELVGALSELIAKDCNVDAIKIGSRDNRFGKEVFDENIESTAIATAWLNENLQ